MKPVNDRLVDICFCTCFACHKNVRFASVRKAQPMQFANIKSLFSVVDANSQRATSTDSSSTVKETLAV